jgi:hypothetical protein
MMVKQGTALSETSRCSFLDHLLTAFLLIARNREITVDFGEKILAILLLPEMKAHVTLLCLNKVGSDFMINVRPKVHNGFSLPLDLGSDLPFNCVVLVLLRKRKTEKQT